MGKWSRGGGGGGGGEGVTEKRCQQAVVKHTDSYPKHLQ